MTTPVLIANLIGAVGVPAQMAGHGVLAGAVALAGSGHFLAAGFVVACLYLLAYASYAAHAIPRGLYLALTLTAAFALAPHLIVTANYAMLTNEAIEAGCSLWGLVLIGLNAHAGQHSSAQRTH